MNTKKCTKCHKLKPLTDFTRNKLYKDGFTYWCKHCVNVYTMRHYHANPSHSKRAIASSIRYRNTDTGKSKIRIATLKRAFEIKTTVINHYSNGTNCCACCGENHLEFLCIHHIKGGGNVHRRTVKKSGWLFHKWLIDIGLPSGYGVLCHNCNQADGNFGGCPHKGTTIYDQFK